MLAIRHKRGSKICKPNILPCRSHQDQCVDSVKQYWKPMNDNSHEAAYFRGRKLSGRRLRIPPDYYGALLAISNQELPEDPSKQGAITIEDGDLTADCDNPIHELKVADQLAIFSELTVWHSGEQSLELDDPYSKTIGEWLTLAQAIHASSTEIPTSPK